MARKTNTTSSKRTLKIVAIVAGVVLLVGLGLYYRSYKQDRDSKTAAVAQEQKKDQSDSSSSSTNSGGVVDNNASATPPTATPPPATSSTPITLSSPADGALVTNGSTLSGTATAVTVQYRFKDSQGLDVATGALTVSAGKYSGSIAGISARSANGTLEVYNYSAGGAEENWVKINVRYK